MRYAAIIGVVVTALLSPSLGAQQLSDSLTLAETVTRILKQDPQAAISQLSVVSAYNNYRSQWAQALPQVSLNLDPIYGVNQTKFPIYSQFGVEVMNEDQVNQMASEGIGVTQALPTAGNLSLTLHNNTIVSATDTGDETTTVISQQPELSVTLSQPLFVNGKLIDMKLFPATLKSTELPYLKAVQQDVSVRNRLVTQGASTYLTVVGLRKQLEQMQHYREVLSETFDRTELAQNQGRATDRDVWSARISVDRQSEAILELRFSLLQTERALARSIGVQGSLSATTLTGEMPQIGLEDRSEQLFERIASENPDVVQGRLDVESARAQETIAGQTYAPNVSLSLTFSPQYGYNRPDADQFSNSFSQLFDTDNGAYNEITFSVGMRVPVYNGGRARKDKAALAAGVQIAEKQLSSTLRTLRDNLDSLLLKQEYLTAKVRLTTDNVKLEQQRLDDERRLLRLSRATDLDVKSEQTQVEARQNELWNARVDLFLNTLDILSLTGSDVAKLLEQGGAQ